MLSAGFLIPGLGDIRNAASLARPVALGIRATVFRALDRACALHRWEGVERGSKSPSVGSHGQGLRYGARGSPLGDVERLVRTPCSHEGQ